MPDAPRIHRTADQLAAIYTAARTPLDLSRAWIDTLPDRVPMLRSPDWQVCADAYMTRRVWFDQLTGDGDRGA